MLSDQEQRAWDGIQRYWAETAEEPVAAAPQRHSHAAEGPAAAFMRRRARRDRGDEPGWVAVGVWVAIFMVLFGAAAAGLALGAVTVLGWALWRRWPEPGGAPAPGR